MFRRNTFNRIVGIDAEKFVKQESDDKGNRYLSGRHGIPLVINNRTSCRCFEGNFGDYFGNDYCRGTCANVILKFPWAAR